MNINILNVTRKTFFVICAFLGLGLSNTYAESILLKNGAYKSLGIGTGYYYYGEVDENGGHIMNLDMALLNIYGNLGYVASGGFKIDFALDANIALGQYTGGVLDVSDEKRDKQRLVSFMMSSFYHAEVKAGYNLLKAFLAENASLYFQAGLGYYFNRTDLLSMDRLQGYLYVPIQLEGEVALSEKWAINYMGGINVFVLGNHLSTSTKWHFSRDLDVLQDEGLGAKAYIGATYKTKHDRVNSFRLVYEYWSLAGSPGVRVTQPDYKDKTGATIIRTGLYEPKNSSHILTLQYLWNF